MSHTGSTYNYINPSAPMSIYGYKKPEPVQKVSYHAPQMVAPVVGIQNADDKINPKDIYKEKRKRKKNEEIEGNTIDELVQNIILEKPNLKILRKAFQKIIDIVEDEKEAELFRL
jgi:hypothetical protein